jgi:hypothetical protein
MANPMPVKATVHSMGHFDILQCQIVYNIEEIEFQYHKIGSDVTIGLERLRGAGFLVENMRVSCTCEIWPLEKSFCRLAFVLRSSLVPIGV